jgi:hypothetical protein
VPNVSPDFFVGLLVERFGPLAPVHFFVHFLSLLLFAFLELQLFAQVLMHKFDQHLPLQLAQA